MAKGAEEDGQDQPLGALAAATEGTLVAVGVLLLIMLVVVEAPPAEATFPGKNGRIAYDANGVIYTVHSDGSGKIKLTNTLAGIPDYSPNGKKITFTSYAQKDAEISGSKAALTPEGIQVIKDLDQRFLHEVFD